MVRLNKNLLTDEQLEKLFIQFVQILNASAKIETGLILREILGYEERIMLAKRLAIVILLTEGHSLYSVAQKLKVSPATAYKIKIELDQNEYQATLKKLGKSKKNYLAILDTIDSILHLGGIMPHYGQTHKSEAYQRNQQLKRVQKY